MSKESLWQLLVRRNPLLERGGSMTADGYRKFFDLVWREAQKELIDDANRDVPDFLKGLFDKR